ncbi:DUF951 domain-containing protein [Haloimpatiens lingqiaonensis]|uniref:DUF951 domain-containing protein n=1 Tax=Haloimpatiens lingqiaonensis TaxID=1380675 RepID=UPI0010FF2480|nr:DUF951 domain-containing protein [Haloimpatiens lingqiaonensis]
MKDFDIGYIVEMKKGHPCGANQWEIVRMGADIKIKCVKCGRIVMIPRSKFEKNMKRVLEECKNS